MKKNIFLIVIITIASLAIVFHFDKTIGHGLQITTESIDERPLEPFVIREYGIPVDSFDIATYTVRKNQTLGSIMLNLNVSAEYIKQINQKTKDVFNIRAVKAGNPYKVFSHRDSIAKVEYLVYEHTSTEYVTFHFTDSLVVRAQHKEVIPITRISEAEINSSLWEVMSSYNLNPVLALDLSEIFAWAVDFFGLQRGDKFKAIYDEIFVDDKSIGIGTIHAAWFEHRGEKFYAFRFMQDSVWSYWDEDGNSLRRSFLKAPLRFSRISSRFSYSRKHPILKIYRPHTGVDYAAPEGTPVVALGDGVVLEKGYNHAAGNFIKIRHNSVYTTAYYHFSRFGKGIYKGARVQQGQTIGFVGKTGYATGPHLDLRFWKNGKPVDPLKVEAPPVEPIHDEKMDMFKGTIAKYRTKLDSISLRPVMPEVGFNAFF